MGKIRKWKGDVARGPVSAKIPSKSPLRTSWDARMKQRADRAAVLSMQREADETIRAEKRAEREHREEKEKKKKENKDKGLQYQVITNMAKIKKMSKKQRRLLKTADTSGVAPKVYDKATLEKMK